MKTFTGAFLALALGCTAAQASVTTFEATISNVTGGAALLSELGIASGGTLTAYFTVETDQSTGATTFSNTNYTYDTTFSNYDALSLVAPSGTTTALAADGINSGFVAKDGIANGNSSTDDAFQVVSQVGSSDPSSYYRMDIEAFDYSDISIWSRSDPISAEILNAMSSNHFTFQKFIGTSLYAVFSSSITFSEVAPVPLSPTLPLEASALGLVGFLALRRRRRG